MKSESVSNLQLNKQKILIVDDHPVFRAGLSRTIQLEKNLVVCAEAASAAEALKLIPETMPDLVIIDLSMEGMNGLELIKLIRKNSADLRILVLSTYQESLYAEKALKAGAHGYIMKKENGSKLLQAIKTVLNKKTYLSEDVNQMILQKLARPISNSSDDPASILTDREMETFELIGQGYGTRQISESLHISMKTVEAHREHMRSKFGLSSNYQLVQRAIKWVHQESHII